MKNEARRRCEPTDADKEGKRIVRGRCVGERGGVERWKEEKMNRKSQNVMHVFTIRLEQAATETGKAERMSFSARQQIFNI